jgi:hypothetical protein
LRRQGLKPDPPNLSKGKSVVFLKTAGRRLGAGGRPQGRFKYITLEVFFVGFIINSTEFTELKTQNGIYRIKNPKCARFYFRR